MATVAIDYGSKRVGLAFSDSGFLASPHSVIANSGNIDSVIARINEVIEGIGNVDRIVLGLPKSDRSDSAATMAWYRGFAEALRQKTCREVVLWDESHTTTEAMSKRHETGKRWRRAKQEIDKEAAAVLLQSYLDEQLRRSS